MVRVRAELTTLALSASCSADYGPIALDELEINFFWRFHFDQSLKVWSIYNIAPDFKHMPTTLLQTLEVQHSSPNFLFLVSHFYHSNMKKMRLIVAFIRYV